ncbi:hypothetical protein GN956_G9375 [Arapaima gigas]
MGQEGKRYDVTSITIPSTHPVSLTASSCSGSHWSPVQAAFILSPGPPAMAKRSPHRGARTRHYFCCF